MNNYKKNNYDNIIIDINDLFDKKIKTNIVTRPGFFKRFFSRYINAFQIKTGLITPMLVSGL